MLKVNLPTIIGVDDYHEFSYLQRQMNIVVPGIKIKEIGFYDGKYQGVAYVGNKSEPAVKKMIQYVAEVSDAWATAEENRQAIKN